MKDSKARKCLRCNSNFKSSWSGNRVCNKCKNTIDYRDCDVGYKESQVKVERGITNE